MILVLAVAVTLATAGFLAALCWWYDRELTKLERRDRH